MPRFSNALQLVRTLALAGASLAAPAAGAQTIVSSGSFSVAQLTVPPNSAVPPFGGVHIQWDELFLAAHDASGAPRIFMFPILRSGNPLHVAGLGPGACVAAAPAHDGGGLTASLIPSMPTLFVSDSSSPGMLNQFDLFSIVCSTQPTPGATSLNGAITGMAMLPSATLGFEMKVIANDVWHTLDAVLASATFPYYQFTPVGAPLPLGAGIDARGFAYYAGNAASPPFTSETLFICERGSGGIMSYALQGRDPQGPSTPFATFPGATGIAFDHASGNMVVSSTNTIAVITGFVRPNPCPCDVNGDGLLDSRDFFDYLTLWFTQGLPSQALFDFLSCFFGGC